MEDIRICFIGDSLTNGAADPTYLGWPGRVCADAASKGHLVTYYNLGVRRDSSADILERWESEIQSRVSKEYDNRLVFAFGANDTTIVDGRPRASPEDSEANARRILEKAASTYPTLMIGLAPNTDAEDCARMEALSEVYEGVCAEVGVPFLSVFQSLSHTEVWMKEIGLVDGSHPSAAGYAALADLIISWPQWWFHA